MALKSSVILAFIARLLMLVGLCSSPLIVADAQRPPNVVLILADDLGFTDLASYGSEIQTPHLSALAKAGVSFSNYHTAANCAPSRAMLLTGVDSHRAGVPNIPEMIPPEQAAYSHYAGTLGDNVVTVATLLQDAGYHTYMAGKWHLGHSPGQLPSRRGFERTLALGASGADNWQHKTYLPIYDRANWYADGEEYQLPEEFYSSRFLVDKMIEFIDVNQHDGAPFFAYLPFQAVHIPVQAPEEFIDRYMGVYDGGWHLIRDQRQQRAIGFGVVPAGTGMVEMASTAQWQALSPVQQAYEAKRMAVYGAMVEAMDHHIGRLVAHLKRLGEYQNTVFIFSSDNGAEAMGEAVQNTWLNRWALASRGYSVDYETLGLKGSFNTISPSFASAAASPLAYYKFYLGEGGMRVPMIIAGERVPVKDQFTAAFASVTDVAPTILAFTGVAPAPQRYGGRRVEPMIGRSLLPLVDGSADAVYGKDDAVGFELAGHGALFMGQHKIVLNRGTHGDGQWHLFNIVLDPGETNDLSVENPLLLQRMLARYQEYVEDNKILPIPDGYRHGRQLVLNALQKRFADEILIGFLLTLILLPFALAYRARLKRRPE